MPSSHSIIKIIDLPASSRQVYISHVSFWYWFLSFWKGWYVSILNWYDNLSLIFFYFSMTKLEGQKLIAWTTPRNSIQVSFMKLLRKSVLYSKAVRAKKRVNKSIRQFVKGLLTLWRCLTIINFLWRTKKLLHGLEI
jgi:hypothetical protein